MICPDCHIKMVNGCCIRCGRLENGNYIRHEEKESKFEKLKRYNMDFDKMYHNDNWPVALLLGPLYFSYRRHTLTGYIIGVIDALFFYFFANINLFTYDLIPLDLTLYAVLFYLLLRAIVYSAFSNIICLKLDKRRMKKGYNVAKTKSILYILLTIGWYYFTFVMTIRFK